MIPHKLRVNFGIFNFFIVIPQIVNGVIGGWIVDSVFNKHAMGYVMLGGCFFILAALLTLRIQEPLFNEASK